MKIDPNPNLLSERFTASVVALGARFDIAPAVFEHMTIAKHEDWIADRLIYTIKTYILGAGEEHVDCDVRWPANWWEAVKDRWLPAWAKRRWPVRYTKHIIHRTFYRAMCPHVSIPPHIGNRVHFEFLRDQQ